MSSASLTDLVEIDPEKGIVFKSTEISLVELLEAHGTTFGDLLAFRYLDYSGIVEEVHDLSWSQFITRTKAVAARIQQVSQRGDRAAVLCRQGLDYVVAFFAAIFAGNIAVPLFEPSEIGHTDRLQAVIDDCKPAVILTASETAEEVRAFFRHKPAKERPRILAVDAVTDDVGTLWWRPDPNVDNIAYLQYTSGSTRQPSGVEITHRSLAMNVIQIITALEIDEHGASVSWLPLFHDMGLVSMLTAITAGGRISIMSPSAFVRRPGRWLQALSDVTADPYVHRAWSAAPNFAYEHAASRGVPKEGHQLDLSKLALLNGSEPVSVPSMNKFYEAFKPYNLTRDALKPCYGLAEATLFVSCTEMNKEARVLYADRHELGDGRFVEVEPGSQNATPQVSCGLVAVYQKVAIVDPETCEEKPDGQIGEIWCHGQNMGVGYWERPEATAYTFQAVLAKKLPDGSHADNTDSDAHWMRTGDLGCYVDGELYVTGRIKDLVIIAGRNHYPNDLEYTAQEATPVIRTGYAAAFTIPAYELARITKEDGLPEFESEKDDVTEHLVIVAERAAGVGKFDMKEVADQVKLAIASRHGVALRDLLLVPAGTIPRTSSGKIAHGNCRAAYLDGTLRSKSKNR